MIHQISNQAFERTQRHAQAMEEHGRAFEQMGKTLNNGFLTQEQAEFVEQAGKQIQTHAQAISELANEALINEEYSVKQYQLIFQEHIAAIQMYVKAIQVMFRQGQTNLREC